MFLADMDRKTLAITPPLLLLSSFFFHLRGAAFGSSKAFHCLLLLSCLLLSSVNTLHNLADYDSRGSNVPERFQSFNGGGNVAAVQNVCPSSHLFSLLPALGSEYHFGSVATFFRPSCPGKSWSNNNLSGVVWLSLKPVHIIEFHPFTGFSRIRGTTPLSKELFAKKNTRELSISVSGKQYGGNGLMEQKQREGLSLEPGDSIKFLFFYQTELSCASGVALLAVPMKATAPVLMLSLCKKPVSWWLRAKKLSVALLIAVALLILIFCFSDHFIEENNNIAVRKVEKPSTITISLEMDTLLRSISKETLQGSNEVVSENRIKPNASVSSSFQAETSELTVKTAKDKKRRRNKKKKKKGAVSELTTERTDVSSSQSGNSTPRSPMSPKPPVVVTQTATKPTPKPVLSHSATFPLSVAKSIQGSSLAPNVRAPGAKSTSEVKEEEEEEEYRYDIWGDHLTGLHLMDRFKEVREGRSSSSCFGEEDDESVSLFVKGPHHNLLPGSHAKPMGLIKK